MNDKLRKSMEDAIEKCVKCAAESQLPLEVLQYAQAASQFSRIIRDLCNADVE